ncbi:type 2 periplasmic-binding domain-containing protein [Jiangella alkaliphila]|uniref:Phosphate transport system substrate-binding protein n=1 Tax=Jiangella alkaliphila TaxID=419479 RepID=A0A1H2LJL5_9ACTN|nr:hypothetical protein [Jiangella alkaliphila]SDU80984.1 phosphate transport system substrate-binding protein [Jiangella alkaliphila]
MTTRRFGRRAAAALGLVVLATGALTGSAHADPPPNGVRHGAGAAITEQVMQGISEASGGLLTSWHSFGPDPIVVKGITVNRPSGSVEGVNALRRSLGVAAPVPPGDQHPVPVGSDVFDFARSSSGPGTNASLTGQLVYVPFALDGVTTATGPTSAINADQFTLDQLRTLYRDGASVTVGGTTYTPDVNITLLVPQSGSETRQLWAEQMQINATTLPAWVHDSIGGVPFQEHDGSLLGADPNAIGPYSIAQWIAQGNGLPGVPDRRNGADLHNNNGVAPYTEATPGNEVFNSAFPITRQLYNVMSYNQVRTGGTDSLLRIAFNGASSRVCTATTNGQPTITLHGFGSLGSGCGAILETLRAFPNG